ncbi:MAG: HAD family hydrolase [Desulfonauticus sp.]|nr:HAD family hydrolase [Desulfonauticus sp.]
MFKPTPWIKNVLLDRDGTIIEEKHYLHKPEDIVFYPQTLTFLKQLRDNNVKIFIVTNQSGLGRGYFSLNDYHEVEKKIKNTLEKHNIKVEATVFCPHKPEQRCSCRKPKTGLWDTLSQKFSLLPEQSVMIGDKLSDIKFGLNARCAINFLVLTGHGTNEAQKHKLPFTSSYTLATWQGQKIVVAKNLYFVWQYLKKCKLGYS